MKKIKQINFYFIRSIPYCVCSLLEIKMNFQIKQSNIEVSLLVRKCSCKHIHIFQHRNTVFFFDVVVDKNETKRASNLFYCFLNEMLTETLFIFFFFFFFSRVKVDVFVQSISLEFKQEHIIYFFCIKFFFFYVFVFHNYKSFLKRAFIWSALVLFKIDKHILCQ